MKATKSKPRYRPSYGPLNKNRQRTADALYETTKACYDRLCTIRTTATPIDTRIVNVDCTRIDALIAHLYQYIESLRPYRTV